MGANWTMVGAKKLGANLTMVRVAKLVSVHAAVRRRVWCGFGEVSHRLDRSIPNTKKNTSA